MSWAGRAAACHPRQAAQRSDRDGRRARLGTVLLPLVLGRGVEPLDTTARVQQVLLTEEFLGFLKFFVISHVFARLFCGIKG